MKVMPTTSPLLGADLLNASIETISASTVLTDKKMFADTNMQKHKYVLKANIQGLTWYVCELNFFGHGSDLLLQILISEAHHFTLQSRSQQLLVACLAQSIYVTLRRKTTETVFHKWTQVFSIRQHITHKRSKK